MTKNKTLPAFLGGAAIIAASILFVAVASAQITSELQVGSSGADVTRLQTFLSGNSNWYPEGRITGYFGPLTRAAVVRFQAAYGIPQVGRVGPMTMAKINELMGTGGIGIDLDAPLQTNLGTAHTANSLTFTWMTNENARGKVYYDTAPISITEVSTPRTEPPITGASVIEGSVGSNHSLVVSGLTSGMTYYYVIQSVDTTGNVTITLPNTVRTD